jgi:hypothetical protein
VRRLPPRLEKALVLLALVLAVSLPTIRTLSQGPVVCVAGGSDAVWNLFPWLSHYAAEFHAHGRPPLWTPAQFYGFPTLGEPQQRILYPPLVVYALFPMPVAHALFWLGHALLLALSAYALARSFRCGPLASAAGSLMLATCLKRFTYEVAGWDVIFTGVTWATLALVLFIRGARSGRVRPALGCGVALALSALAGNPTFFAYLGLGLPVAFGLALRRRHARERLLRFARTYGVAFGLGFLLASPLFLCALRQHRDTARSDLKGNYGYKTGDAGNVLEALASPDLTRVPGSWESSNDLGAVALPLAGAGLALRRRRTRLLPALAGVFLILSLGTRTPLGRAVELLPVFSKISYPSRLLWFVTIAEAALAAVGLDALLRLGGRRRLKLLVLGLAAGGALRLAALDFDLDIVAPFAAVLIILTLLPLAPPRVRRPVLGALVVLTAIELLSLGEQALVRVPYASFAEGGSIEAALRREKGARVAAITTDAWSLPVIPFSSTWDIPRADGYNPLAPRAAVRYLNAMSGRDLDHFSVATWISPGARLELLQLGVTHIVSYLPPPPEWPVVATDERPIYAGDSLSTWTTLKAYLAEVPGALPRAFVLPRARAATFDEQLAAIARPTFDGHRDLFVSGPVPPALEGESAAPLPAEVVHSEAERVTVRASVPEPGGFIVLLDAFSDDWTATIDGAPAPIQRANVVFRAVHASPGAHTVEFVIRPPGVFYLGCALALLGVLAAVGLALRERTLDRASC